MKLHEWQVKCLENWENNGFKGIVNAVTGSGKTFLALSAIQRLENTLNQKLCVKIVVPQTFLAGQWKAEIRRYFGVKASEIGIYCGARKEVGRKYTIYVINSARYNIARHILSDINSGNAVFLIADECHHYGSTENNRIFDFYGAMASDAQYYSMGLSATPEIVNFKSISVPLGKEIYCYGLGDALRDKVISRFMLFSVGLEFTPCEREEYSGLSERLASNLAALKRMCPELSGMQSGSFFTSLSSLAQQNNDVSTLARNTLMLSFSRRSVCHMASKRPKCAVTIVRALPKHVRIILFCERIETAQMLWNSLSEEYPRQVGLYHSEMSDNSRQDILQQYEHGTLRMLVCCKALDEGLNIPSTDVGIVVSTSMSARQRIQRIGRILRISKEIKRIYFLYIRDSNEDRESLLNMHTFEYDVPVIALRSYGTVFVNSEYTRLREKVISYVEERCKNNNLIEILNDNLDLVLLRGDFLQPESVCLSKIHSAQITAERNYWVAVLYIIHARIGKLD